MTSLNNVKEPAPGTAAPGTAASGVPAPDVVVVGAGPTGLALAIDLTRRGVHALVLERSDTLFPGSRGKGLQPRTLEVLDDLGVGDAVLAHSATALMGRIWQDGKPVGERDMLGDSGIGGPTDTEPHPRARLLPQWRTQQILFERLTALGGRVAFGTALTGLAQDSAGVTARLSDGSEVRAAYLVAADGGRSLVRQAVGIAMTAPSGEGMAPDPMLVADIRLRPGALDRDHWHLFPGEDGGFAALCPLPGTDDYQLVARTDDLDVPAVVAARTHLSARDVTEVRWASDFRPRAAMADRFRAGRVLLAGDAAHVHSPAGGQGLNTSVQDAYNLGWKLGQILRHGADPALLHTYHHERAPVAAQMLGLSTRIHRGEEERGKAGRQLGLGYRGGPLSEGSAGALEAGDRAPDGPLPDGRRLFDLFRGPHFTLLTVGTDIELPPVDAKFVRIHRIGGYEPYGQGVFLVRPDGYVGWAGEDTAGLSRYLARFGGSGGSAGTGG
ncbi:FAD-dependent oxidoreductase [Streptomyces sp. NBC_00536]|uniref:FAD-dependent monooxygenase n=1 Tax=Streptomyces sp. NBC_00536 TaxID=2975769 RepID=UPI002E81CF1D|nr:FAD-dependent monooxygenase [Streptomyces sp. NBC_00536]WUC82958.1 FAD-dependent oxidoreductase [Streptomyces sp. NBC_00536]